ncbi:MAG: FmdB family zinc ribbon protein [Nitriliruptoraceae bacterium]
MPVYAYRCSHCSAELEVRASVAEKTAGLSPTCDHCGSTDLRQQFRAVGLIGTASAPASARMPAGCGPVGCGPVGC